MNDAAFLDDLETRVYGTWSDEDTLRLWNLGPYRVPPASIRAHYSRDPVRRLEMIADVRSMYAKAVLARMTT